MGEHTERFLTDWCFMLQKNGKKQNFKYVLIQAYQVEALFIVYISGGVRHREEYNDSTMYNMYVTMRRPCA